MALVIATKPSGEKVIAESSEAQALGWNVPSTPQNLGVTSGELVSAANRGGGILQTIGSTYVIKPAPTAQEISVTVKQEIFTGAVAKETPRLKGSPIEMTYRNPIQKGWELAVNPPVPTHIFYNLYAPRDYGSSSLTSTTNPEKSRLPIINVDVAYKNPSEYMSSSSDVKGLGKFIISEIPKAAISTFVSPLIFTAGALKVSENVIRGNLESIPIAIGFVAGGMFKSATQYPFQTVVSFVTSYGISKGFSYITKPLISQQFELQKISYQEINNQRIALGAGRVITKVGDRGYESAVLMKFIPDEDLTKGAYAVATREIGYDAISKDIGISISKSIPYKDVWISYAVDKSLVSKQFSSGIFLTEEFDKGIYGSVGLAKAVSGFTKVGIITDTTSPSFQSTSFISTSSTVTISKAPIEITAQTQLGTIASNIKESLIPKPINIAYPSLSLSSTKTKSLEITMQHQIDRTYQESKPFVIEKIETSNKNLLKEASLGYQFQHLSQLINPIQITMEKSINSSMNLNNLASLQSQRQLELQKQDATTLTQLEKAITPNVNKITVNPNITTFFSETKRATTFNVITRFPLGKTRSYKVSSLIKPTASLYSLERAFSKYGTGSLARGKGIEKTFRNLSRSAGLSLEFPAAEFIKGRRRK